MRSSRRITWIVFALCALLVADGLGWVTWQLLRMERREHIAQHEAQRHEAVRLALWRMDSAITPLVATEAARPYFHYRSFFPAERAYTRMWEEVLPGEVLVPSPLLAGSGSFIKLHFEIGPDGTATSPQAPVGNERDLAESFYADATDIMRAEAMLYELERIDLDQALRKKERAAEEDRRAEATRDDRAPMADSSSKRTLDALASKSIEEYQARAQMAESARNTPQQRLERKVQRFDLAQSELQTRAGQAAEQSDQLPAPGDTPSAELADQTSVELLYETADRDANSFADNFVGRVTGGSTPRPNPTITLTTRVRQGPFEPVWRTDPASGRPELMFIREIWVDQQRTLQGFWIDWPALREELLSRIVTVLPRADLVPVTSSGVVPASATNLMPGIQLLASIPARLTTSALPATPLPVMTSTRATLIVIWIAVLVAIGAIGVVLRTSMNLSERRGRFVSAVTHELRTPLTTFCLYAQMLDDGMVPPERRGEYLATLRRESSRLARVVESVLAYARLDRRAAARARESTALGELLDEIIPGLERRCAQEKMTLIVEMPASVRNARVPAERDSIERILVNLVDNACKYAGGATDARVTLAGRIERGKVVLTLSDAGPGVPRREHKRIFASFERARRDEAGSSPGLGLGLALARGLARELGGDLRLMRTTSPGASFALTIPLLD